PPDTSTLSLHDALPILLYHLEYPPEAAQERGWPAVVVAKTYRGDKGQNAYDAMRALWRSPLGTSPTVRIAEPLAYLPELSVLVQDRKSTRLNSSHVKIS